MAVVSGLSCGQTCRRVTQSSLQSMSLTAENGLDTFSASDSLLQALAKHLSLPADMQSSPSKLVQHGRTAATDGPVSRRFHQVSMVNQ